MVRSRPPRDTVSASGANHPRQSTRTPAENLARLCAVLHPAMADLATAFGVPKQRIDDWLHGAAVDEAYIAPLRELAEAADLLCAAGVRVTPMLLKRRVVDGKTLLQAAPSGGAVSAAEKLIDILAHEQAQRERLGHRLARRGRVATADFDLPLPHDRG